LLSQRDFNKKNDSGKWTVAVVGTNDVGETYEKNIIKEAKEELGLDLDLKNLESDKPRISTGKHRYFGKLFFVKLDVEIFDLKIQKEEVEDVRCFSRGEIEKIFKENPDFFTPTFPKILQNVDEFKISKISEKVFVNQTKNENSKIFKVLNSSGEMLDTLVEGNFESDETIIFVHGCGVNKDDGDKIFVDVSKILGEKFRCVRYDASGCEKSEGKEEDMNHQKFANDFKSILNFVQKNFGKKISVVGMSQGTIVLPFANFQIENFDLQKILLISPVNSNAVEGIERKKKKILSRGGTVDEEGISFSPRSSGKIEKIGSGYWKTLRNINIMNLMEKFSEKAKIAMIRGSEDEFIPKSSVEDYKKIENFEFIEIHGSHTFKLIEDRKTLLEKIKEIFEV